MFLTKEEIENRGAYHPPTERAVIKHGELREIYKRAATWVNENTPDCRESSTAQTRLEEFLFWANAAIARNHDKL